MNLKMIINSYGAQIALFGFCMYNLYINSKDKKTNDKLSVRMETLEKTTKHAINHYFTEIETSKKVKKK